MAWRDNLQRASFRGVAFLVDAHEANLGRRVQVHEYPLRDKPYAEDLGRKSRTLTVEAFVLGADYMAARGALLTAVELGGPGTLVHPYLGEMQVTLLSCKLRESTAEGGIARFALEFVEAGEKLFASQVVSTAAVVAARADFATDAFVANLNRQFAVLRKPDFVARAAGTVFGQALAAIGVAMSRVRGVADQVAGLQHELDARKREVPALIYTPALAAQALVSGVRLLVRDVAGGSADAWSLARVLLNFGGGLSEVAGTTPSRRAQAANQAALVQLVRVLAVAEGARAVSTVAWGSYQAAIAARDELLGTMDAVMLAPGLADEPFAALRDLRAAVVRDAAASGANLARLVSWTPVATAPALVLAHTLYGDAGRADELLVRNHVRHPLFVPGAVPLEVLSDG